MSDLADYLETAKDKALRSLVHDQEEYLQGWCDRLGCTPQELAERFDLRSETSAELDGEVLRFITRMKLEPKDAWPGI